MELMGLSLVSAFFSRRRGVVLEGLFVYIVVSSIASSFILSGVILENLFGMVVLGFRIKFGLFPFLGWVYKVFLGSNWFVVWGLSTFLKFPYLLISYLMVGLY